MGIGLQFDSRAFLFAHLAAVAHDAGQAAREQEHVQQRLEGVAVQVGDGEGELLHVLRDALVRVRQA